MTFSQLFDRLATDHNASQDSSGQLRSFGQSADAARQKTAEALVLLADAVVNSLRYGDEDVTLERVRVATIMKGRGRC